MKIIYSLNELQQVNDINDIVKHKEITVLTSTDKIKNIKNFEKELEEINQFCDEYNKLLLESKKGEQVFHGEVPVVKFVMTNTNNYFYIYSNLLFKIIDVKMQKMLNNEVDCFSHSFLLSELKKYESESVGAANGYVVIKKDNNILFDKYSSLYEKDSENVESNLFNLLSEKDIYVHGGITYTDYFIDNELTLGFDTCHHSDGIKFPSVSSVIIETANFFNKIQQYFYVKDLNI